MCLCRCYLLWFVCDHLFVLIFVCFCVCFFCFFFFKQKTAYEMRISDWSSDVCSSDLRCPPWSARGCRELGKPRSRPASAGRPQTGLCLHQIGRASCRERVCQYV